MIDDSPVMNVSNSYRGNNIGSQLMPTDLQLPETPDPGDQMTSSVSVFCGHLSDYIVFKSIHIIFSKSYL